MNWELVAQLAVIALILCFVIVITWAAVHAGKDAAHKREMEVRRFEAEHHQWTPGLAVSKSRDTFGERD